eukprot:jgi/Ulvmu1/4427/UM002_0152.1
MNGENSNSRASVQESKRFPNGDVYVGGWQNGLPHGEGVYKWADGSEYAGAWQKGQKHGVGRYKWPSGATYQGEWVQGMMQGVGAFEAVDGTMYSGSWLKNRKHGLGKKIYANQDCYEGLWRQGKAWGPGRYMWVDGNEYDGEWSNGVMHGQGTFVWRTGERYDGEWKCGLEDGQGIFTWADGSVFDGFWSKGRKHGVGLYRTSKQAALTSRKSAVAATGTDDLLVDDITGSHTSQEAVSGEGPIAAPTLDRRKEAGTSDKLHAEAMYVREYDRGRVVRNTPIQRHEVLVMLTSLIGENQAISKRKLFMGKNDKVGEIINQDHRSYELMLDLQLGVRWSVSKVTQSPGSGGLTQEHFENKVKVAFPREGSRETPPHPNSDFRWKDYCPMVFRKLRTLFVVDPGEYMLSICGEQALRELSSPGKSGALFYISHDDRFLIKTMRRNEMRTFLAMLPQYYDHVQNNPHTLVTKFYGLYRIKLHSRHAKKNRKIRFVVMGNVFNAEVPIHQRYDLKGSTHGRFTKDKTTSTLWKDCDLDVELQLTDGWKDRLDRQLSSDAAFLRSQHVMDYSLLMGIHYKNREQMQQIEIAGQKAAQELAAAKKQYLQKIISWQLPESKAKDVVFMVHAQLRRKQKRVQAFYGKKSKADQGDEFAFRLGEKRVQLGVGMQAKAVHKATGLAEDVVVYFGIIDFLQEYSPVKRAEHAIKAVRYDGNSVSVVDPTTYASRFTTFLRQKVFQ